MSWTTPTPRQRPLWKPIWPCHELTQLQDNDLYKINNDDVINKLNPKTTTFIESSMTMSWTTPTSRHRPPIIIIRYPKFHCLQDNDLYENQYDDVLHNPNSKTKTFMTTKMSMSWTTPTPRQRLSIIIKRYPKYHWLQDNDLCGNQYDDVMNDPNSKTTTFTKANMTMSWITSTPRQRPLWRPIRRCHEQPQLQDNDLYEDQYDDVTNKTTTAQKKSTRSSLSTLLVYWIFF